MPLIADLFNDPIAFFIIVIALLLSLSVHEAAHAYMAKLRGDDTAEALGRLTLNPLSHLDPIGSLAILLVGFGWAKPVPVTLHRLHNPKLDYFIVALAGPLSNLILACLFALINLFVQPDPGTLASTFTLIMIQFNLALMFFNLIPIPPLDGSKVLQLFVSEVTFARIEQNGYIILLALIALGWAGFPILSRLIFVPTQFMFQLLT